MCSLVDLPVMHVLLATRQRAFLSQAYSHRHTERRRNRSRAYLIINPHFFTITCCLLDTLHSLRSVGVTPLLIGKPLRNHATIAWFFFISIKSLENAVRYRGIFSTLYTFITKPQSLYPILQELRLYQEFA